MTAPPEIERLVQRFHRNRESYRSPAYNETQVRREFVDPLFKALGWDIDNTGGFAEAYKPVIHEDSIKIGGSTKVPDYSFRIGGVRKFFVETKKPAINIHSDPSPAFQLRRYAWSAKLPLSILTDFEEFAVYDCRIRPDKTDQASKARTNFLNYGQYLENWDDIAAVFSHESLLKGSFDAYADSTRTKRGTQEVDDEFLKEIEEWRNVLARNIAVRNEDLSQYDLNLAVQKTIDRLIFLRICEDRGIEEYGQLRSASDSDGVYLKLCDRFRAADERYNSGLFHFNSEPGRTESIDTWTLSLTVDDAPLKNIIGKLYYPESPYEFSVLGADILGQVYEQFLGKVIRLTKTHRAKVEEKPEVKKAGGVFYTPTYIVDHIVKGTIGKLLEEKDAHEIAGRTKKSWKRSKRSHPIRVLDPACGSGSFLIGAYQYLLDWYHDCYVSNDPTNFKDRIYQLRDNDWRLATAERKRILLDHIFGVDIDPQAVEVTKLSLLLKVLEGENQESLQQQMQLIRERALPDLGENIKCGNSLISSDFFEESQFGLLSDEERLQINIFDWPREFPQVFDSGGFDAVIGNPPYIDSEWMTRYLKATRDYCVGKYEAAAGNWDLFCVFTEQALRLCRPQGYVGMIVPNKIGSAEYASSTRHILVSENTLLSVRDFSSVAVFPVAVYPVVFTASRQAPNIESNQVLLERMSGPNVVDEVRTLPYETFSEETTGPWRIFGNLDASELIIRMQSHGTLGDELHASGAATVAEAYKLIDLIEDTDSLGNGDLKFVNSGTIDPYKSLWGIKNCRYLGRSLNRPVIREDAKPRAPDKRIAQSEMPKIIVAGMTKRLECIADFDGQVMAGKSTTIIYGEYDLSLLLAILNSRVISFYYDTVYGGNKLSGGYLRIGPPQLRTIPVPTIDSSSKPVADSIIRKVERINSCVAQWSAARSTQEKKSLDKQIAAMCQAIDLLVYRLFDLSEDEIVMVENATDQF